MNTLKAFAKKSKTVHSAVKFARNARDISTKRWPRVDRLYAIFKVLPNTMLPMPRLFDVYEAVVTINKEGLRGDIVECGVWNGGCVGLMALANLKHPGPKRQFHLFDSFRGLPQPCSHDVDVIAAFKSKYPHLSISGADNSRLFPIGACVGESQSSVENFLVRHLGIDRSDLVFHAGWFHDTIPKADINDIALLRLDGDWYESTKTCLDNLYEKVVEGGYIIIDDYGAFSGCAQAVDEFFGAAYRSRLQYSDQDCVFFRKSASAW
jgi:hypothetical protein